MRSEGCRCEATLERGVRSRSQGFRTARCVPVKMLRIAVHKRASVVPDLRHPNSTCYWLRSLAIRLLLGYQMNLNRLAETAIPIGTGWLLGNCMEARGKQELWIRQK